MKQTEKLDLILKGLYKDPEHYHSLKGILLDAGEGATVDEIHQLGQKLKSDGYMLFWGGPDDVAGQITINGKIYVEGDSYTYRGRAIISNHYNISIVNSPNANLVNQSRGVSIDQSSSATATEAVENIRQTINASKELDPNLSREILECLQEIEQGIKEGRRPKFAIKSLLDVAANVSQISSWLTTLGQFAGILPL